MYAKNRWRLSSSDLKTWEDVSAELSMPKDMRHGTAFKVPGEVVRALLEQ